MRKITRKDNVLLIDGKFLKWKKMSKKYTQEIWNSLSEEEQMKAKNNELLELI